MVEYIEHAVEDLRETGSQEEVELLLGVSGDRDAFVERVSELGATVEGKRGRATLQVSTPKAAVDAICRLDGLKSAELNSNDVRTHSSGTTPRETRNSAAIRGREQFPAVRSQFTLAFDERRAIPERG